MTNKEYQDFCSKEKSKNYCNWLLAIGLGGETGEVLEIYKKAYRDNKQIDKEHLKEELGDVLWYIANICTEENFTLDEIIEYNINKLTKRYSI